MMHPSSMRRLVRRLLMTGLAVAALAILLVVAVQTPPGKRGLAGAVGALIEAYTPYEIDIQDLSGLLPHRLRVGAARLTDQRGDFILVEGLELRLSLSALLRGRIHAHSLTAARLDILHRPIPPERWRLPRLPALPIHPDIDLLQIDRLVLGEAVLGAPAVLSVNGHLRASGVQTPLEAAATIRNLEAEHSEALFSYRMVDGAPLASILVEDEVVLPAALDLPAPVSIQVDGKGGRADWRGALTFVAGGETIASGALHFAESESSAVEAEFHAAANKTPFLREHAAMIGNALDLRLQATLDRRGMLDLREARLSSELIDLQGNGHIQLEEKRLDLVILALHNDSARAIRMNMGETPLPLRIDSTVQGAFNAPEAAVKAALDGAPIIEGAASFKIAEALEARGAFHLAPPPIDMARRLPAQGADLSFTARYDDESGSLTLDELRLTSADMDLIAQGNSTLAPPTLRVEAALDASDLSALAALTAAPILGKAEARLKLVGDAEKTTATLTVEATNLDTPRARADSIRIDIESQGGPWTFAAPATVATTVAGQARGFSASGLAPMNLEGSATLEAPALHSVQATSLKLTDGNAVLEGTGRLDLHERRGAATLHVAAAAVDRLPGIPPGAPSGALTMDIDADGAWRPLLVKADINGVLRNLGNLPKAAMALAGDAPTFAMQLEMTEERIEARSFSATGTTLQLSGEGAYLPLDGNLSARLEAALPDLRPLGAAFDQALSGSVSANFETSGPLDNLEVQGEVLGQDLAYQTMTPVQARFQWNAKGLPTHPEANIDGRVDGAGQRLLLKARSALENSRLVVAPFEAVVGENRLSGQGSYALGAGGSSTVQVKAELPELAALAALVGLPLSGNADASLELTDDLLSLAVQARDLDYAAAALAGLELEAHVEHIWKRPSGRAVLNATAGSAGPISETSVKMTLQGDLDEIRAALEAEALVDTGLPEAQRFRCSAEGLASHAARRFTATTLEGALGAFDFALEAPAALIVHKDETVVEPLRLRLGDGHLHFEGRRGPDTVEALLRADSLPLELSRLAADPAVVGRLQGEMRLTGALAAPEINLSLKVDEARIDLEAAEGFAPFSAELTLAASGGRLAADLSANMPDTLLFKATADAPLDLSLRPFRLVLPKDKPLSGAAEMEASFEPILQALGLVEHRLDARLRGAFHLAGTLNAPDASGEAHIQDGRYENALTGTSLRNLTLHAQAEGPSLRLLQCTADTGDRGRAAASGEWRLAASQRFPFKGKVIFEEARLAQLDYLSGQVNGALNVEGNLDDALIEGKLVVGPVQVSMPEHLSSREAPALEVTEIRGGEITAAPEPTAPRLGAKVRLDIQCDVPGRFYVRAPILDSEWSGSLRATGTLAKPNVQGRIAVSRGHLDFLGRRFALRDSAISFLGGPPTDPYLDMRAAAETPNLSALLKLQGDLDEVALELTSDPPLPQDEVLAQVLFGRDLSRISPVQAIQLARIAAMFNRGLAGLRLFSGNIGLPGIDRLDIRTGERADETVLGMGKYFTDSVYVEVEQGPTSGSGKVSVEVEVTPRISVKGDVGAKERAGVGLFWNRDY